MKLIQILLPLYSNEKKPFPQHYYEALKAELTQTFGGVTAYTRSPASGLWKEEPDKMVQDDIILYEVMAEVLDQDYWLSSKQQLLMQFQQDQIIIRTSDITLI